MSAFCSARILGRAETAAIPPALPPRGSRIDCAALATPRDCVFAGDRAEPEDYGNQVNLWETYMESNARTAGNSIRIRTVATVVGLSVITLAPVALAAEKTLEFQLVTKNLDPRTLDAPANFAGQTLMQSKAFGVAVFKDGRIGTKDYTYVSENIDKGAATGFGYSTYYFDDGSVSARFTFTVGPQGGHGDYKILSGTGAYAGATGTGTFDPVPNPFKNAGLFKVKLQMVTP
jgi:hypothetical protein